MSARETISAEDREHALLSASSAKIWLACTPSARFAEKFEDSTSAYAEQGTAAHTFADLRIRLAYAAPADFHGLMKEAEAFCTSNAYYDAEMERTITEYVDFVIERYAAAQAMTKDAVLFTEQRLDYSAWAPEGFGTGDVIIIADGLMEVIDLKYGQGVPVSAEGNPQLRLYAAGAWAAYEMLYDIDTIQMTICQPRLDSISTSTIAVKNLLQWLDEEVRPKADQAWAGAGEFTPGEHCRFCNGLTRCRAIADHNLELAKFEFKDAADLSIDEIAEILGRTDLLTMWVKAIGDYALEQALQGVEVPGWKVVEGRSNRAYIDQDAVAKQLVGNGYEEAIIYERNLLGITAMEKTLGKKNFNLLLANLVAKPPGAPKLAPSTDPRPAIGSADAARSDFEEDTK